MSTARRLPRGPVTVAAVIAGGALVLTAAVGCSGPVPTAAPTATAAASAGAGRPATITLEGLGLDAGQDPDGEARRVSFIGDGPGPVTVALAARSGDGPATMCLTAGGVPAGCRTTDDGRLETTAPAGPTDFVLTLRGEGAAAPVVDVTLTFPAEAPAIAISRARFDGTAFPATNGIRALVTPRSDGDVRVAAEWGGHPFLYELELVEQGGPGSHVLADQGPATRVAVAFAVTVSRAWELVLQNTELGFGPTELDASIAWP
jgi:hypothetical protein